MRRKGSICTNKKLLVGPVSFIGVLLLLLCCAVVAGLGSGGMPLYLAFLAAITCALLVFRRI
jgi:hypothetical protein